eukprot:364750-Chlamydomonas_euryale.AAC.14
MAKGSAIHVAKFNDSFFGFIQGFRGGMTVREEASSIPYEGSGRCGATVLQTGQVALAPKAFQCAARRHSAALPLIPKGSLCQRLYWKQQAAPGNVPGSGHPDLSFALAGLRPASKARTYSRTLCRPKGCQA